MPTVRIKRQPLWEVIVTAHVGGEVLSGRAQFRARHIEDLMKKLDHGEDDKLWEQVLAEADWQRLEREIEEHPEIITGLILSVQKVDE